MFKVNDRYFEHECSECPYNLKPGTMCVIDSFNHTYPCGQPKCRVTIHIERMLEPEKKGEEGE